MSPFLCGGGGTCHYQVPIADDTLLRNQDDRQESKLLVTASLDVLPPGEVYVPFPSGSGNNNRVIYYSCPGRMSEHDQVYPAKVFDPKTQKHVLRTIWKPRTGTLQYPVCHGDFPVCPGHHATGDTRTVKGSAVDEILFGRHS
jgi:hypothetical protein